MALSQGLTSSVNVGSFVALERQVTDLERAIDFYVRGLGFELLARRPAGAELAHAVLALGAQRVVLVATASTHAAVRVDGPDVRFAHIAIVTRDMAMSLQRLQALCPEAITHGGPQLLPAASGGATAFKFRDADGHPLELIEFAAANCPQRWRGHAGPADNLGIDHAAISVSDVAQSIAFYQGIGFTVGARQVNRGVEQARLDGLHSSTVEVVAMRPGTDSGPHLELLAYIAPAPTGMGIVPDATHEMADRLKWQGAGTAESLIDPDGHLHSVMSESPFSRRP